MKPVAILAAGAISALGRGRDAFAAGRPGDARGSALALDTELTEKGVRHALVGRAEMPGTLAAPDRAEKLLALAAEDLARELDRTRPAWRSERVAVVVGTSSGGMGGIELALGARARGELSPELARQATYFAPLRALPQALGLPDIEVQQILAACASSTIALGLAARWLEAGRYDLVLAGGYDALSLLVTLGFDALGALTRSVPRPFQKDRDGMALGEGAALLALALSSRAPEAFGHILGFAASSDAVHITAPDRNGQGLSDAAAAALDDAGVEPREVALVSAHATATPYNDAAESLAMQRLFGDRRVPVQAFKATVGHTLGAAGALETLAALSVLEPDAVALKLSSAFGGANAVLVLGGARPRARARQQSEKRVALRALGRFVDRANPAAVAGLAPHAERLLARADSVSELVLAAVADLIQTQGVELDPDTAVVVGTASATLEVDELFDRRRRAGQAVEPQRFPATSPNLSAGLCSIAFRARGPSLAVGSGPGAGREALLLGYDLVAFGDAPSALVVAVEDIGPVVEAIFGAAGWPLPRRGASAAWLGPDGGPELDRAVLLSKPAPVDPDLPAWFEGLLAGGGA